MDLYGWKNSKAVIGSIAVINHKDNFNFLFFILGNAENIDIFDLIIMGYLFKYGMEYKAKRDLNGDQT